MLSTSGSGGDPLRAARTVLDYDPEIRERELATLGISEDQICAAAREQVVRLVGEAVDRFVSLSVEIRGRSAALCRANLASRLNDWRRFGGAEDRAGTDLLLSHLALFNACLSVEVLPLVL